MKRQKIAILDWDYTLFDTFVFKKSIANFLSLSLPEFLLEEEEKFQSTPYSLKEHLKLNKKQLHENDFFKHSLDSFLLLGVKDLIDSLKLKGYLIILLTYGNKNFQKQKINSCSTIVSLFDEIIYAQSSKLNYLKEFLKYSHLVIINDNAKELITMANKLEKNQYDIVDIKNISLCGLAYQSSKNCYIFLKKGHYNQNIKHNMKPYSLKEMQKIIKSYL